MTLSQDDSRKASHRFLLFCVVFDCLVCSKDGNDDDHNDGDDVDDHDSEDEKEMMLMRE